MVAAFFKVIVLWVRLVYIVIRIWWIGLVLGAICIFLPLIIKNMEENRNDDNSG